MDFSTAASVGVELFKNRQNIGAALNGVSGAGKLAGAGFSKIAQKFNLPGDLGTQVGQVLEQAGASAKASGGMQVLNGMQFFDADKNGQISREELTQGLQKLQDSGQAQTGDTAKLYKMGDLMLKNYERLSQQDGLATGISYKDMGQLMAQDGAQANLTPADWQKLNA